MRRIAPFLTTAVLVLAACGGGSDDAADTTVAADTTAPVATETAPATEAPPETEAPAPTETEAPVATEAPVETEAVPAETDPAAPAGAIAVNMVEWAVEAPTSLAAGTVAFDVSNGGDFPHHFAVARGNSYEELPQTGGGAIDEATLGADFLGRTANIQSGETATISFDLTPGNYVFFCNIAGTVSHAAQGQVLSVTVA